MKKLTLTLTLFASAGALAPANPALLVDDDFANLSGWTDGPGNWSVGTNLTYSGLESSGGAASELTSGTGAELSNNIALGSPAGGTEL